MNFVTNVKTGGKRFENWVTRGHFSLKYRKRLPYEFKCEIFYK